MVVGAAHSPDYNQPCWEALPSLISPYRKTMVVRVAMHDQTKVIMGIAAISAIINWRFDIIFGQVMDCA
jgi:hypothetical protein